MEENSSNPATDSTGNTTETSGDNPTITYAGKYNSVGDLENAYIELQSTFSKKMGAFEATPEQYTFSQEGFESNDMSDALGTWGKENSLSNDGINSLYDALGTLDTARATAQTASDEAYMKEQTEALGQNATSRIKNTSDWVRANIGEEAADSINQMWGGAKGIEAIEKIMKMSQGAAPVNTPAAEHMTLEKVNAMQQALDQYGNFKMNDPQYATMVRGHRANLSR